jgi:hypothetical protein
MSNEQNNNDIIVTKKDADTICFAIREALGEILTPEISENFRNTFHHYLAELKNQKLKEYLCTIEPENWNFPGCQRLLALLGCEIWNQSQSDDDNDSDND